jgi:hypothetical protein
MLRNLVLLAALALLLVPLGANARVASIATRTQICPYKFNGSLGAATYVSAGSSVTYNYQATGKSTKLVHLTLYLPSVMRLVKSGTAPYSLVHNRPTWVMKNINSLLPKTIRGFNFVARVKLTAQPGRYRVLLKEDAQNGSCHERANREIFTRVTAVER